MKYLEMFLTFFKIGAFTFGGGWAMLPIMEREFVETKGWIEKEDFVDIIAVSQSFPGVLAVNASTFIGKRLFGFPGALLALLGVALPSIIIILIIAHFFVQFRSNYYVAMAMNGINAAVPALIIVATKSLWKAMKKDQLNFIVLGLSLLLLLGPQLLSPLGINLPRVHPLLVILAGAAVGILRHYEEEKNEHHS